MVSDTFLCKQKKLVLVSIINYTEQYYNLLVSINIVGYLLTKNIKLILITECMK